MKKRMKKKLSVLLYAALSVFLCLTMSSCSIAALIKHFNEESAQTGSSPSAENENRIDLSLSADRNALELDDEVTGTAQLTPAYDEETVRGIANYLKVDVSAVEFTYQWKSSDTSVVKVDKDGKVTATGKGQASVLATAKIKGKTGIAGTASYDFTVSAEDDYYTVQKGGKTFAGNEVAVGNPGKWYFYCDQKSVIEGMSGYFNRNAVHLSFEEIPAQKEWYLRYQPQGVEKGENYALAFTLTLDADAYIRYGGPKGYRYLEYYEAGTHEVTVENLYFDGSTPFSMVLLSDEPAGVDDKSEFKEQIVGGTFSFAVGNVNVLSDTLSISAPSATIDLTSSEHTTTLTATDPSGGTFRWTSSDETVATVDSNGVVTGVGEGTAVVTATNESGRHVSCRVTVITESVSLDQTTGLIDLDDEDHTLPLTATVNTVAGTPTPALTWTSSDTNVATVDPNGVVTGLSAGQATITVSTGKVSATCLVSVAHGVVGFGTNASAVAKAGKWFYYYNTTSISKNPVTSAFTDSVSGNVTVTMNTSGKTTQLKYQPVLSVGTTYEITFTVTAPTGATFDTFQFGTDGSLVDKKSDVNGGVTTFTYRGTVDASKPFIISYKMNKTGDLVLSNIAVTTPAVLSKESLSLDLYDAASAELSVLNYAGSVSWSSDAASVVTVENGVVTAHATGEATITATLGDGTKLYCTVTVSDSTPAGGGEEPDPTPDPTPDRDPYGITVVAAQIGSSSGKWGTFRGYIAAGTDGTNTYEKDTWYALAYSNTAKG